MNDKNNTNDEKSLLSIILNIKAINTRIEDNMAIINLYNDNDVLTQLPLKTAISAINLAEIDLEGVIDELFKYIENSYTVKE